MSKVYLVNKHYDNHEPYEDNFQYDETLMAFDTKKKAENFIKGWLPKNVFSTREEAKKALKKEWDALSDEEKEDYYSDFNDFVYAHALYIKTVEYDVKDSEYIRSDGNWETVIIPKVITLSDKGNYEEPSIELTIKELEVY